VSPSNSASSGQTSIHYGSNKHHHLSSAGILMCDPPSLNEPPKTASPLLHAKTQGSFNPALLEFAKISAQNRIKQHNSRHSTQNVDLTTDKIEASTRHYCYLLL